jgi:hypothetical protein
MATDSKEKADSKVSSAGGEKKGIMSKLPPWLGMAVRKPRVWKTWVRCMIATFATLILMLVQPCRFTSATHFFHVYVELTHSAERPWPSSILWSNHVSGKIPSPPALTIDYPSLHGCRSIPDCNHHHDHWDMYGLGMGSGFHGCGSTSEESGPTQFAGSEGTGWVSHLRGRN